MFFKVYFCNKKKKDNRKKERERGKEKKSNKNNQYLCFITLSFTSGVADNPSLDQSSYRIGNNENSGQNLKNMFYSTGDSRKLGKFWVEVDTWVNGVTWGHVPFL